MNVKIKNFLELLKRNLEVKNISIDATLFDYDSYENYLKDNDESSEGKDYFSVSSREPYCSITFEIDAESENIVLVASNGYDWFPVGLEKDLNDDNIQDEIMKVILCLIS